MRGPGLYAIVDTESLRARGLDVLRFADAVLAARPCAIQLRDKLGAPRDTLALLRELAPRAAAANVPLYANDRPDLAVLAGAPGVHLGQDDLSPEAARKFAPGLAIGRSTHGAGDVERALDEPIDYLAIGPVFATSTKADASPVVGLDALGDLVARVRARADRKCAVVAIGGVTLECAPSLAALVDAAASIAALLPDEGSKDAYLETSERTRALHRALGGRS